MTRESAWGLLTEFTQSESLRKHALAVEACMRAYARKLGGEEAKSVRKKMKDKAFARSVSREDIINGAQELGVDLEEHIAFCVQAMKSVARELGLEGTAA